MKKVYVLGDSISIHYGPYLERFLEGVMDYSRKEGEEEALLNLDNPLGANAGDSSMVLAYLQAKAESGGIDADVLLLNCGLHDIKTDPLTWEKQISLECYRDNLRAILQVAGQMGLDVVWVRTTPCDENVHNHRNKNVHRFSDDCRAYNDAADDIMAEAGVAVLDLYTFTLNLGPDLYCDHVHFHDHTSERQAAFIAGWLAAWQKNRAGRTGTN